MRFIMIAGTTETAQIEGISAAGTDPNLMVHAPSVDLEIIEYGQPVGTPAVPVSPTGCPTPAVITRAVHELANDLDLDLIATGPRFDRRDPPAMNAYVTGEAKEGVGRGGVLALSDRAGVSMVDGREQVVTAYDRNMINEPSIEA